MWVFSSDSAVEVWGSTYDEPGSSAIEEAESTPNPSFTPCCDNVHGVCVMRSCVSNSLVKMHFYENKWNVIKRMNSEKSPGMDGVIVKMLKLER